MIENQERCTMRSTEDRQAALRDALKEDDRAPEYSQFLDLLRDNTSSNKRLGDLYTELFQIQATTSDAAERIRLMQVAVLKTYAESYIYEKKSGSFLSRGPESTRSLLENIIKKFEEQQGPEAARIFIDTPVNEDKKEGLLTKRHLDAELFARAGKIPEVVDYVINQAKNVGINSLHEEHFVKVGKAVARMGDGLSPGGAQQEWNQTFQRLLTINSAMTSTVEKGQLSSLEKTKTYLIYPNTSDEQIKKFFGELKKEENLLPMRRVMAENPALYFKESAQTQANVSAKKFTS